MSPDGPKKPAGGEACNGCGLCCAVETCPIALIIVPHAVEDGPCPALEWEGGRSWCGLIRNPEKHADGDMLAAFSIVARIKRPEFGAWMLGAIGSGVCDSGPEGDAEDWEVGMTAWERVHG